MEKGKMTTDQRRIKLQKSIAMEILHRLEIQIGRFDLNKYAKDNDLKGLCDLNEKLTDISSSLINLFEQSGS